MSLPSVKQELRDYTPNPFTQLDITLNNWDMIIFSNDIEQTYSILLNGDPVEIQEIYAATKRAPNLFDVIFYTYEEERLVVGAIDVRGACRFYITLGQPANNEALIKLERVKILIQAVPYLPRKLDSFEIIHFYEQDFYV